MDRRRNCLICSTAITETRLGIDACRACATFFKRTTINGKKLVCRRGLKQCTIKKYEKLMCRSCRFDKCVSFGMEYDVSKLYAEEKDDCEAGTSSLNSASSSISDDASESLIARMEAAYKASYDRRLVTEREYVRNHKMPRFKYPKTEFYTANMTCFYDAFRIFITESRPMLLSVFDDFDSLSTSVRTILFKNFARKFSMIESVYLSKKHFKDANIFVSSLITCGELTNVDQWARNNNNDVMENAEFRTSLKLFSEELNKLFVPMIKSDEITEREFYALAILSYCDVDTSLHLPDETLKNASKTRAKVFNELHEYYRNELNLHDVSTRIGNLMSLTHLAGEAGNLLNAEMRMYSTMFGLYSDDRMFLEFFSE